MKAELNNLQVDYIHEVYIENMDYIDCRVQNVKNLRSKWYSELIKAGLSVPFDIRNILSHWTIEEFPLIPNL